MPTFAMIVWIATLALVGLVIVPVALALLRRVLNAAWRIEGYLADMKTAGLQIAAHTDAVSALDGLRDTASDMEPVARSIRERTAALAALLSERASPRAQR